MDKNIKRQQPQLQMFVFHVHQAPYMCSFAIWCTSYWQLKLSKTHICINPTILKSQLIIVMDCGCLVVTTKA